VTLEAPVRSYQHGLAVGRPFATVDIVQNCLAFSCPRSDPCVDRAARGTKGPQR
jgi:hypothetical protein